MKKLPLSFILLLCLQGLLAACSTPDHTLAHKNYTMTKLQRVNQTTQAVLVFTGQLAEDGTRFPVVANLNDSVYVPEELSELIIPVQPGTYAGKAGSPHFLSVAIDSFTVALGDSIVFDLVLQSDTSRFILEDHPSTVADTL